MVRIDTLSALPELTVEQAEHWIAAALEEAKALRQHDDKVFPATGDPADMRAAEQLHQAWRQWADAADALYERLRPLLQSRHHLQGASDLQYAIARTRAMLKFSPAEMLAREEQVRRGDVKTMEEVKRELRIAPRR